ncbi:MAG: outer membrane lipoprotein carrier protein LolA [Bacteroidales bacterium]|nr:outer membrane lipoprotein carrier protein LolA [Bacteroidales bacterium]
MRRLILFIAAMVLSLSASAQPEILDRLKEANAYETLQLSFVQTRHSAMLADNLVSEGRLYLASPDRVRWEVMKPFHSVFVSQGELAIRGRRFRMPSEKDFSATVLEGEDYSIKLIPLRRDLKSLFREIVIHADKRSLQIRSAVLVNPDGDWTLLEFKDILTDRPVDPKLFEEE